MTRTVVTLTAAAALAAAGPAAAQNFGGPVRPGGYYTSPFGSYSVQFSQRAAFSYSFVNPFTGVPYNYSYNSYYTGPTPFGGYNAPRYYAPYAYGGAPYGTTITPRAGGFNPVAQRQLRALQGAAAAPAPRQPAAAVKPANLVGVGPKPAAPAGKPVDVDPKLANPADEDVLSGKALNAIAAAVRDLEAKGAKADPPLLPADLLGQVTFGGPPGAGAIAALRDGVPPLPELLQRQEFLVCRKDLEKHLAAVTGPVSQGKAAPAADVDGLAAAIKKCRETDAVRELPLPDAVVVTKFLDGLEAVVQAAKNPEMAGVVVPKWGAVGATTTELVRHMDKHKLTFAPAATDAADAYRALHRGLAGYYAALAAAGVKG